MNCLTEACSTPTSPGALVFAVMSSSGKKIRRDGKRLLYRTDCLFHHSAFRPCPGNIPEEYAAGLEIFSQKLELTVSK